MTKAVINLFDNKSSGWDDKYSNGALVERLKSFSKYVQNYSNPDQTLLDIGCGSGVFSQHFNELGYDVCGIDISEGMIKHSKSKEYQNANKIQFVHGSLYDMCDKLKVADNIVCSSVLEYVDDDKLFLDICYRLLSPGGTLFITVPNLVSSVRKKEILFKKFSCLFWPFIFVPKVRKFLQYLKVSSNWYTINSFKQLAKSLRYEVVENVFFNPTDDNNKEKSSSMLFFVLRKPRI